MSSATHPHPEQDLNEPLVKWEAPSHPYKRRDKVFFQTVAAITFLCVVIVFFLHEFLLIGVILSVAFVIYVIETIKPVKIEHKVTPLGFSYAGHLYPWQQLEGFWFEEKWGETMIVFHNKVTLPTHIKAMIGEVSQEHLKKSVGKYLYFMEHPPKTWSDTVSNWLEKKFPLEPSKQKK